MIHGTTRVSVDLDEFVYALQYEPEDVIKEFMEELVSNLANDIVAKIRDICATELEKESRPQTADHRP